MRSRNACISLASTNVVMDMQVITDAIRRSKTSKNDMLLPKLFKREVSANLYQPLSALRSLLGLICGMVKAMYPLQYVRRRLRRQLLLRKHPFKGLHILPP